MRQPPWLFLVVAATILGLADGAHAQPDRWDHTAVGNQHFDLQLDNGHENSGLMTFAVPHGWTTRGQWFGNHPDERYVLSTKSPGNSALIQIGDGFVPEHYIVPNPGFQRGQILNGPGGMRLPVAGYSTGAQFAKSYATMMYGDGKACSAGFQVTDVMEEPLPRNAYIPPAVNPQNGTAGLAFFVCNKPNNETLLGVASAATWRTLTPEGAPMWYVGWLWHYLASPQNAPSVFMISRIVSDSIRINPQWIADHFPPSNSPGGGIRRNPDGTYSPDVAGAYGRADAERQRQQGIMQRGDAEFNRQQGVTHQGDGLQNDMENLMNDETPTYDSRTGQTQMRPYTNGDTHCTDGLGHYTDSSNSGCGQNQYRLQNR